MRLISMYLIVLLASIQSKCMADNVNQIFKYNAETKQIMLTEREDKGCVDYDFISNVYTHACNIGNNQKWTYDTNTKQIISDRDGKCLDIDTSAGKGLNLRMIDCMNGNENQQFHPLSGGGFPKSSQDWWRQQESDVLGIAKHLANGNMFITARCLEEVHVLARVRKTETSLHMSGENNSW